MEITTKLSWGLLVLIHLTPTFVLIAPGLVERLYGVSAQGDLGVLLTHRGGLFLAIMVAAIFAAFVPDSRKLASLVVGISMLSFLILYMRAGWPAGPLRKIAMMDAVGLVPLAFVSWQAWR